MLRVLMTPLHTRSFRHLPPLPSCLLLVLVEASKTGLAGVETDSLNWILQGMKYWTSLSINFFLVSSSKSSRKTRNPGSNIFLKAFMIVSLVSWSLEYFLHCCISTCSAVSLLLTRKSLSGPLSGNDTFTNLFSWSSSTESKHCWYSCSSLNDILSFWSASLHCEQFLHLTHL